MPLAVTAPAALVVACLLALGFHRNRAVQVLGVLAIMAAAFAGGGARAIEGALRFGPWLALAAVVMPEPRLLSRRHGLWLLAGLILAAISLHAPEHVFRGLAAASAWLSFKLDPARAAAAVLLAAALLSLLRWTFTARPMELGLCVVIFIAAAACAQTQRQHQLLAFTGAGGFAALAVLYASYRMAFIDGLTGLPNRRALDEALMRVGGGYALAMVDIDHFKQFNDTYGHGAGDVVLRTVARTLRRHVGGQTFRYGGEEFCVIFEGRRAGLAADGCERAREAVQQHRIDIPTAMLKGKRDAARGKSLQVSVTISVGCAERAADRKTAADVLKAADQALYKAKAKGRNRVIKA